MQKIQGTGNRVRDRRPGAGLPAIDRAKIQLLKKLEFLIFPFLFKGRI